MADRRNRIPPALKHGAYSAIAVLPGESQSDFNRLHRDLIVELDPSGALENDIVGEIAHLVWRKQNLATLRVSEIARKRLMDVPKTEKLMSQLKNIAGRKESLEEAIESLEILNMTVQNIGGAIDLTHIRDATMDGLEKELALRERLNSAIDRCLKQLLLLRGVKSISATPFASPPKRVAKPSKTATQTKVFATSKQIQ